MSPKADWESNTIPKLFPELNSMEINSILDIGGGLSNKTDYILEQGGARDTIVIVLDIFKPVLEEARKTTRYPYNIIYIHAEAIDISVLFLEKSFDLVILFDIIEHNIKPYSYSVLEAAQRIAKKAVIVEVPLDDVPQNLDVTGWNNPYQEHRSAWEVKDLEELGYVVRTRPYQMMDVKRHTDIDNQDPNITLINAIKLL